MQSHSGFAFWGQIQEELQDTSELWGMEGQGCLLDTSDIPPKAPQRSTSTTPGPLVCAMVQILMMETDKTKTGIPTSQRSINQHT